MNSTEGLIKKLATSQTIAGRDYSPVMRTLLFVSFFFPAMAGILYLIRPFSVVIQNLLHGFEILSLSLFLVALTYFGFKAFVPGEKLKKSLWMVIGSSGLMLLMFSIRLFEPQLFNEVRPFCELEAIAISVITTLISHVILKKNEFALNTPLAKTIFLSLPMIAAVMLHGVCSLQPVHVILCHVVSPLIVPVGYLIFKSRQARDI
jgi:hypothetical protein